MNRYFKIVEIDKDTFIDATGEDLDCCQLSIPVGKDLFVAVDECEEYEISVPLDLFDEVLEEGDQS